MAKEKTVKICETQEFVQGGFGADGGMVAMSRIVEIPDFEVPEGAVRVPDDTPVTDWLKEIN